MRGRDKVPSQPYRARLRFVLHAGKMQLIATMTPVQRHLAQRFALRLPDILSNRPLGLPLGLCRQTAFPSTYNCLYLYALSYIDVPQ